LKIEIEERKKYVNIRLEAIGDLKEKRKNDDYHEFFNTLI